MKPMKSKLKIKSTSGITLIALIVTIIVLLILAGVGISMLMGENGVLKKATKAKEETIKAQLKEELELAIIEIQVDELEKVNSVTLYKIGSELKIKFNDDIEFDNLEDNQERLTGEYKGYEFTIEGTTNKVTIGEKITGITISSKLDPQAYTAGNVTLTVNAISKNGKITSIEGPEGLTKNQDGTYTITENGKYNFTATDSIGMQKTQQITINTIDKEKPEKPTIELVNESGFTIKVNATDSGSGIKEYKCYIAESGKEEYKEYVFSENIYQFKKLKYATTYRVYVIAYDKVGNESERSDYLEYTTEKFTIITEGLVEYWPLVSDLDNMYGSTELEIVNSSDADSISEEGILLDGDNNYLCTTKKYEIPDSFTITLKVKPTKMNGHYQYIIGNLENDQCWGIALNNSMNYFVSTFGSYSGVVSILNDSGENVSLDTNDYNTITLTYDDSKKEGKVYINGVLQWTDKNGNTAYNNYLSLKIGGSAYYGHGGLNGYYKDILIYNRALSNDEIQDMNEY